MSTFAWIACALWVSAACQVYDRIPWGCRLSLEWPAGRRLRTWLWAKALALRSWVFRDELGDELAREAGRELAGFDANATAEEWTRRHAPPDPPAAADPENWLDAEPLREPPPRRRPTRAEAATARKKAKR